MSALKTTVKRISPTSTGTDNKRAKTLEVIVPLAAKRKPHDPTPMFDALVFPDGTKTGSTLTAREALEDWLRSITDSDEDKMALECDLKALAQSMEYMDSDTKSVVISQIGKALMQKYPSNFKALDATRFMEGKDIRALKLKVTVIVRGGGLGEVGDLARAVLQKIVDAEKE